MCPARTAEGSHIDWNERILEGSSKPYEEIEISVKVKKMTSLRASVTAAMVWNSTFCFLHDLRD